MPQAKDAERTKDPGQIDIVRLISNLNHRDYRRKTGLFFVEGIKLVTTALRFGFVPDRVFTCPEAMGDEAIRLARKIQGPGSYTIGKKTYQALTEEYCLKQGPDGIGVIFKQRWQSLADLKPGTWSLLVALCSVQDRGNVGSILRTCDAIGCSAVAFVGTSSDPFGPSAVKASAGAVFTQQLVQCSIQELRSFADSHAAKIIGTSPAATGDYHRVKYQKPTIFLVGNEGRGLSDEELAACDETVGIPMFGFCDSLNAAVATSVVLFEVVKQWNE